MSHMANALPKLNRPPKADAESVQDLVQSVLDGKIRVPHFQRGLKWDAKDVIDLFDSIYRGLPIGSILLVSREATAAHIEIGPLRIAAPHKHAALFVVDGQQRLTAMAASLARPRPYPTTPDDPYIVYFDARDCIFVRPPKDGRIPEHWVPLQELLDSTALSNWVLKWRLGADAELPPRVFEAGKRIREFRVPMITIETDDEELLRQIFYRVNKSGKPLKWDDVYDALYGHRGSVPGTIEELALSLGELHMGSLDSRTLLGCLLGLRGLDVTQTLAEHRRRDQHVLAGAVEQAGPVLSAVLQFLKSEADVSHLRLLPETLILPIVARFFAVHSEPSPRSRELLRRWVWRVFLGGWTIDEATLRRRGVAAIREGSSEEVSVQELLKLVPASKHRIGFPERFDARASGTRLMLLGLSLLRPQDEAGSPIDVGTLLDEGGAAAFVQFITHDPVAGHPANRTLAGDAAPIRSLMRRDGSSHASILASHAITLTAAQAFRRRDFPAFLENRKRQLLRTLELNGGVLAGWVRADRDRPSLEYLLQTTSAE